MRLFQTVSSRNLFSAYRAVLWGGVRVQLSASRAVNVMNISS